MLKRWKQFLFLSSLVTVLCALWLWSSTPTPVHACDDLTTVFNECEMAFDFEILVVEKITVYRYTEINGELFLCARNVWVYINDRQTLIDNRSKNGPIYPRNGSVGVFKQATYEALLNDGVIDLAPVPLTLYNSTEEECAQWGGGHIEDEGPPTIPEWDIEPLDPIDPPLWKEVELEAPMEGVSQLFAYGYETEAGFYALAFVHDMD